MKNILKIITVLVLLNFSLYVYDVYSGFKITGAIDNLTTEESVESDSNDANSQTVDRDMRIMYSQLSDSDKALYNKIYTAVSKHKSKVYLIGISDSERVFELVKDVLSDHPEIFYYSGQCSFYSNSALEFSYDYTKDETFEIQQRLTNAVNEVSALMDSKKTDYEKSLCAYEWIISNTTYDSANLDNVGEISDISNIDGVFLNHMAVCSGYAKAYQYLLNQAGIPAVLITGNATENKKTDRHAWICQKLNDEYYFSDPTWGDSFEKTFSNSFISHTYFCLNSDQISKTHTPDERYNFLKSEAVKYNYFSKEGFKLDEYSETKIRNIVKNAIVNGDTGFELYFPDNRVYNKAKYKLIDSGEVYIYMKSVDLLSIKIDTNVISYNTNDEQNVIMFAFKNKK